MELLIYIARPYSKKHGRRIFPASWFEKDPKQYRDYEIIATAHIAPHWEDMP